MTVEFRPELSAYRGRLESGSGRGEAVLAASYIPGRRVVLDSSLRAQPVNLARLATHELFHFVWVRLSNARRRSFEDLLVAEWRRGARGELGWSAEWRKDALDTADVSGRSRRWREYAAESFCDSAAWIYRRGHHPEFTLKRVHRERRRKWFSRNLSGRTVSI